MCLVKSPKPVSAAQAAAAADKPVPVLRNPYLDGLDPTIQAGRGGTRSFRINRTAGAPDKYSWQIRREQAAAENAPPPPVVVTPDPATIPPSSIRVTKKKKNTLQNVSRLPGVVGQAATSALAKVY